MEGGTVLASHSRSGIIGRDEAIFNSLLLIGRAIAFSNLGGGGPRSWSFDMAVKLHDLLGFLARPCRGLHDRGTPVLQKAMALVDRKL
jgi:hypothetical protein